MSTEGHAAYEDCTVQCTLNTFQVRLLVTHVVNPDISFGGFLVTIGAAAAATQPLLDTRQAEEMTEAGR